MEDEEVERLLQRKMRELMEKRAKKEREERLTPLNLDDRSFEEAIRSKPLALVDFWADWCAPCKVMHPIFDKLCKKYGDKVFFGRLNVDEHSLVAARYNVFSIPTFVLFRNGVEVAREVGAVGELGLERILLRYV